MTPRQKRAVRSGLAFLRDLIDCAEDLVDAKALPTMPTAETRAQALQEAGITMGDISMVRPGGEAKTVNGTVTFDARIGERVCNVKLLEVMGGVLKVHDGASPFMIRIDNVVPDQREFVRQIIGKDPGKDKGLVFEDGQPVDPPCTATTASAECPSSDSESAT